MGREGGGGFQFEDFKEALNSEGTCIPAAADLRRVTGTFVREGFAPEGGGVHSVNIRSSCRVSKLASRGQVDKGLRYPGKLKRGRVLLVTGRAGVAWLT